MLGYRRKKTWFLLSVVIYQLVINDWSVLRKSYKRGKYRTTWRNAFCLGMEGEEWVCESQSHTGLEGWKGLCQVDRAVRAPNRKVEPRYTESVNTYTIISKVPGQYHKGKSSSLKQEDSLAIKTWNHAHHMCNKLYKNEDGKRGETGKLKESLGDCIPIFAFNFNL